MTYQIFISYSSKDKVFAFKLAKDLQDNSINVWYDDYELEGGDYLLQRIEKGIKECRWFGIIFSYNSVESDWVQKELGAAFAKELEMRKTFILPIKIDNCEIPLFFRNNVFFDFRNNYSEVFEKLISRIMPSTKYSRPPNNKKIESTAGNKISEFDLSGKWLVEDTISKYPYGYYTFIPKKKNSYFYKTSYTENFLKSINFFPAFEQMFNVTGNGEAFTIGNEVILNGNIFNICNQKASFSICDENCIQGSIISKLWFYNNQSSVFLHKIKNSACINIGNT